MLTRQDFRQRFGKNSPIVFPVIHVLDAEQVDRNIKRAMKAGAAGCFLINHHFNGDQLIPILKVARENWPEYWLGVNFLGYSPPESFAALGSLSRGGCEIDACWVDNAGIETSVGAQSPAAAFGTQRKQFGWSGLYFGGTAFKYQAHVSAENNERVAISAAQFMDVVTTSGPGTGVAADPQKIASFRSALGDVPLAIASGISAENVHIFRDADCFLVASSINRTGDFFEIDENRLNRLIDEVDRF